MTILGIDFGTKRVGVAISDTTETLAFPKDTFQNNSELIASIADICKKETIRMIVLGQSLNLKGEENLVMEDIRKFKVEIEENIKLPVIFQQEYFSSFEAGRFQGITGGLDASAAAIILQRFLDKKRANE